MIEWIEQVITQTHYIGIFLLMLVENVFPPIPSEIILPMTGMLAAGGELSIIGALLASSLGALAGAVFWYWVGLRLGRKRLEQFVHKHGRWTGLTPPDYKKVSSFFERHKESSVFLARMVPGLRSFISIPAGLFKMGKVPFLAASLLGIFIWNSLLFAAGYYLRDSYQQAAESVNLFANGVIIVLIAVYIYKVIRYRPENQD